MGLNLVLEEKLQSAENRLLRSHQNYPLKNKGQIKIIPNKQNLRELITSRPDLAEKLKRDTG